MKLAVAKISRLKRLFKTLFFPSRYITEGVNYIEGKNLKRSKFHYEQKKQPQVTVESRSGACELWKAKEGMPEAKHHEFASNFVVFPIDAVCVACQPRFQGITNMETRGIYVCILFTQE